MAKAKKSETSLTLEGKLEQALIADDEQPYKVPDNWCWVKLNCMSKAISKGTTPTGGRAAYQNVGVAFLRVENINDDGTISHENIACINEDIHKNFLKRSILNDKDVLVSIAGTLGKTGIVREIDLPLNTNQAIAFIRLISDVASERYIKYAIDTPIIQRLLLSQTKVTAIPNLTLKAISNCPMPLPPISEQQRIVNHIETFFSKLDEVKENVQNVIDGFENRKSAILHKAFNGELTAKWRKEKNKYLNDWEIKTIGNIADVKGGKRVPKGMTLTSYDTGHPYIKAGNLKNGTVIDDEMMYVPDDVLPHIKKYTVNSGDVYITNVGACIGDCGIIPAKYDGANFTENAVKIINYICNGEYLALYLTCSTVQQKLKELTASATLGKLSIAKIKTIKIKLPSLEEQIEIVSIIKRLFALNQLYKEKAEDVLERIELIKKSILARAFRGELGTNNPDEESSLELLKMVLSEDKDEKTISKPESK